MVNIFFRAFIIYIFVVAVMRLSGKVEVGQMTPAELVFSLLIADLAATPLADDSIPLLHGLMPILALLVGQMLLSVLTLKSRAMRSLLVGRPSVVVRHGKIDEMELARQRLCVDDLLEQIRIAGYSDLTQVETAIFEPSGDLSVFPKKSAAPPGAQELGLSPKETGLAVTIVADGCLSPESLQKSGHDERWLQKILSQNGVSAPQDVLVLSVDEAGTVFFQKRRTPYKAKSAARKESMK